MTAAEPGRHNASVQTASFHGREISKLVIGTVQFGMYYGLSNRAGQPSEADVVTMVQHALDSGVNAFDTAVMYGTSESVLGQAFGALGVRDRVFVSTKVPPVEGDSEADRAKHIERAVAGSRGRLGLERLPLCLFHRFHNLDQLGVLLRLREQGLIEHAGVSVYQPDDARVAIETEGVSAVQIQSSLLDQRFIRAGTFELAAQRGVAVFCRSVFMQGLLTMSEEEVPEHVRESIPVTRQLRELAGTEGIVSHALRYVASLPGVTGAVVGMETVDQLQSNVEIMNRGPLREATIRAIDQVVPDLPSYIVNPGEWRWNDPYEWKKPATT